jgi:hypothetical protein
MPIKQQQVYQIDQSVAVIVTAGVVDTTIGRPEYSEILYVYNAIEI